MTAAAPNLADTIASIQASQTRAAMARNEKEIEERLVPIIAAEPLTQDEMAMLKEFMEWAKRKEVKYYPTRASTVALWISDNAGHKNETELLAMLEAIKRMHDQYGASNPCATCAVERMLAVVIKAEPPRSWPKAEKALFATLDPALRAIIAKREQERETGLRRQQNKLAEEIKKLQQPPQPTEQKKEVTNV